MNNSTKVIFEKSIKGMTGISLTDEELSLDFIRPQFLRKEPAVLPEVSELEAMRHFKEIGTIIYLKLDYQTVKRRLGNLKARGVVLEKGQTLRDLYNERIPYYEKYADITVKLDKLSIGNSLEKVLENL